jgi:glutamate--cysteine ligase
MSEIESMIEPVTSKEQLVQYLAAGCKPRADWRIGTEHEKFAFNLENLKPLPYEGRCSIRAMLEGLTRFGWTPVTENDLPIALTKGGASITLEPGGQFELSGETLGCTSTWTRSSKWRPRSVPAFSASASIQNGGART